MTRDNRKMLESSASAQSSPVSIDGSDPLADFIVINALGGIDDPNLPDAPIGVLTRRVITDARASGVTAVNCTLGYVFGPNKPFQSSIADIGVYDTMIRKNANDFTKITSVSDIRRAKTENKIGLIYGFQNAVQLGDDVSRVNIFANLGVRIIQLTYNLRNKLGSGSMVTDDDGLTLFGHEVIERLNASHVMVDLSHSGRQTCLDAIKVSRQPISINHTGCRALTDLPRNKTDEELRLIAESGGFIGIYFMPFLNHSGYARAMDVVAHIEHAINICGEDHVGIGTDGGTTPIDDLDGYEVILAQEHADRKAQGIAALGERADTHPFVDDLRGPGQFRKLYRLMAERGHKPARIEKLLGANFIRYASEVWGE